LKQLESLWELRTMIATGRQRERQTEVPPPPPLPLLCVVLWVPCNVCCPTWPEIPAMENVVRRTMSGRVFTGRQRVYQHMLAAA